MGNIIDIIDVTELDNYELELNGKGRRIINVSTDKETWVNLKTIMVLDKFKFDINCQNIRYIKVIDGDKW